MVKKLVLNKIECEELLGKFLDESNYDTLIDFDCDVYRKMDMVEQEKYGKDGEHNIILMFRKNYFSAEQQIGAYDGLKDAAQPSQNRGLAAGPKGEKCLNRDWATTIQLDILHFLAQLEALPTRQDIEFVMATARAKKDTRGMVWLSAEKKKLGFDWIEFMKWVAKNKNLDEIKTKAQWVLNTLISDTTYANPVDSGIAGWFDRYPRIPYGRATAYTQHNFDKFKLCYPFMIALGDAFKKLLPVRYKAQMDCAYNIDPSFRIPKAPFTTITVNKNFRTAAHRDAGDLARGFSNLTVVAKNNDYDGGYLILPEVKAAVNIRPGDLLLVANHDYIHGNTPILAKEGVELERISLVCYFREAMLELGERGYEDLRYKYVETRRKDEKHWLWREGWNGVSKDMFDCDEWFDFLKDNDGEKYITMYHNKETGSNLELLFG